MSVSTATAMERREAALRIVLRKAAQDTFPATDIEKRADKMPLGEVVRLLQVMNEAGFRNLAICRKGLVREAGRLTETGLVLKGTLRVTFIEATRYVGWMHISPCLVTGKAMMERLDSRSPTGRTNLMRLAGQGDVKGVRTLIGFGVDVNAKDQHGQTALMAAALGGRTEVIQLLVSARADTKAKDHRQRSAMDHANRLHQHMTKLLISEPTETKS
jgi:hypothetical protein